jgi:hypothetical protein
VISEARSSAQKRVQELHMQALEDGLYITDVGRLMHSKEMVRGFCAYAYVCTTNLALALAPC